VTTRIVVKNGRPYHVTRLLNGKFDIDGVGMSLPPSLEFGMTRLDVAYDKSQDIRDPYNRLERVR
jgi:hypothetical protein